MKQKKPGLVVERLRNERRSKQEAPHLIGREVPDRDVAAPLMVSEPHEAGVVPEVCQGYQQVDQLPRRENRQAGGNRVGQILRNKSSGGN